MRTAFAMLLVALMLPLVAQATPFDRMEPVQKGWDGSTFKPSYSFPAKPVTADVHPWETISFRREPKRYLAAVLAYALAGQDRQDWRLEKNLLRRWYHAPWMGP